MPIKVEDVEIVVKEMLKEDLIINPEKICLYMGIDPIVVLPRGSKGEWNGVVDNGKTVYNHLQTLREKRVEWRRKYKEAYESFRDGYKHASYWDKDQGSMIYYKDKMSYKEFVDMRIPEEGIFLIPKIDNLGAYIIPNKEEEKQWRRRHILGGTKTIITRIKDGVKAGYIEDTRATRKFIKGFDLDKYLIYKEEEVEEE